MKRIVATFLRFFVALSFITPLEAQTVWHVDAGAFPMGDGASWATAFDSIDDAITASVLGDSIWVREGTYRPKVRYQLGVPRSECFFIPQGVKFRGGFDGTETSLAQRANHFEQTILSGDLGTLGDPSDNAYVVVRLRNPSGYPPDFTYVDGFQIRDGNGVAGPPYGGGGGINSFNSALVLTNCILRDNASDYGGALYAQPGLARVADCLFENNYAAFNGGALIGKLVNLRITNCVFRGNVAGEKGGVLFQISTLGGIDSHAVMFGNCLFHDNSAQRGGAFFIGGGFIGSGKLVLANCTLAYNWASVSGGAISTVTSFDVPGSARLRNCIVWGNEAPRSPSIKGRVQAQNSCIEVSHMGGPGNIFVAPRFVDALNSDFRLAQGSPAIDSGSNRDVHNDWLDLDGDGITLEPIESDLAGARRITDDPTVGPANQAIVDMGAFEFQPPP